MWNKERKIGTSIDTLCASNYTNKNLFTVKHSVELRSVKNEVVMKMKVHEDKLLNDMNKDSEI